MIDILRAITACVGLLIVAFNATAQDLILSVDRVSGAAALENSGDAAVAVKGYTIGSGSQLLNPDSWVSLTDAGLGGWVEANPSKNFLSELNRNLNSSLDPGASFELGNPYSAGPAVGDLFFEYITADLTVVDGAVRYTGPANDLAVYIDPATGQATMANLSPFIDVPTIKGYSILSPSEGMLVDTWTSLADTGIGGPGWREANPNSGHLSELNRDASTTFALENAVSLGQIIQAGDTTRDLIFEYITVDGEVLLGSVEYIPLPGGGLTGDCDGNGVLNADDLGCVTTIEERDAVLSALNTVPGDLDGNGQVAFADFLVLSTNFNQDLPSYTAGNIDLEGTIGFPDFLILSTNFGQPLPALTSMVPEPTGFTLVFFTLVGLFHRIRRFFSHR